MLTKEQIAEDFKKYVNVNEEGDMIMDSGLQKQKIGKVRLPDRMQHLLDKRMLWDYVIDELNKKHVGDVGAKEIIFLSAIGRLVKNKKPYSFNVIVHSDSSAGKDHLVESVLSLFPNKDIEAFGRISKTALTYLHDSKKEPFWTYDGKILYLEEVTEEILNNEIMKVFTAGLTKSAITKDQAAEVIEVKGKPVVICTTATSKPTPEILNRFSIVKLDESEEQTRRTYAHEEEDYNGEIMDFISKLKPMKVNIPTKMRKQIADGFPANKTSMRRAFPRFLDIVKAIAVFHRNINATWEDYDLAVRIFSNYRSGVASVPIKPIDQRIVNLLMKEEDPLSAVEISSNMEGYLTQKNVYLHLNNLENNEILETFDLRDSCNRPVKKYKVSEDLKTHNSIKLQFSHELQRENVDIVDKNCKSPFSNNISNHNNTNNNNNNNNN